MFKNIVSSLFALVAAPGKAWQSISSKEESQATFLNGYLYPIMGITALSVFVNLLNELFVGYTLSVYMLITIFLNLFMGMFSFLRFAPLYIIYVIWEGSKYYMDINENKRLIFVVLSSLILIFSPDIIERFMFILMPGLGN